MSNQHDLSNYEFLFALLITLILNLTTVTRYDWAYKKSIETFFLFGPSLVNLGPLQPLKPPVEA